MEHVGLKKILLFLGGFLIIFSIGMYCQADFWSTLLIPVGDWAAFCLLVVCFLKTENERLIKWSRLGYTFVCLCWAVGDTFWAIYKLFFGLNPRSSVLISSLYLTTNTLLVIAGFFRGIQRLRKWNCIQLLVDVTAVCLSAGSLLWILYFEKSTLALRTVPETGVTYPFYFVIDFLICVGVCTHWLSSRACRMPLISYFASVGVLLFVVTDAIYFYNYIHFGYDNPLLNAFYMVALLLIAVGEYYNVETAAEKNNSREWVNIGFKHKGLILLISPFLVVLFKGLVLWDLAVFFGLFFAYELISGYIQTAIQNEQMLKREQRINLFLEDTIAEHTKKLADTNKELMKKNEELFFLSNQDAVTKLYNRRYFIQMLAEKIDQTSWPGTVALVFIDLDRFKTINDTYGHHIGDQVLIEFANRFKNWNAGRAMLARLGGDEFVFAFTGQNSYIQIEKMAEEIIRFCGEPVEIHPYIFHVTMSIGISIYPLDAQNASTLMKNADMAMYLAKSKGYNKYVSFVEDFNKKANRKNAIEILLKKADFDKEFQVFYQPQFSIPEKKLVGMEALLRWERSDHAFIPPEEFIPIAEEIDYIIPIGQWVMKQAIRQISQWNSKYLCHLKMGINVSPKQLDNLKFIGELRTFMNDSYVDPRWIDIELTENVAMEGGEYRIMQISDLFKGLGVSISIDDFGTGYSSLSYLKLFPFDRIKIAKPLIDSISADGFDKQIVKAIVMLAKATGVKTIAEGVETQEQFDILTELGCEEVQGYLLGKPMPAEEFEKALLEHSELLPGILT